MILIVLEFEALNFKYYACDTLTILNLLQYYIHLVKFYTNFIKFDTFSKIQLIIMLISFS
jgi:hypothetical protein